MCFIEHRLVFQPFQCLSLSHAVFLYRMIFSKSVLHRTKADCMMRKLSWVQSCKWFQQACLISYPSQFIFFIFLSKLLSTCSLKGHLWKTRWEVCQTVGTNDFFFFLLARAEDYFGKNGVQRLVVLYLCITFWRVHTIS